MAEIKKDEFSCDMRRISAGFDHFLNGVERVEGMDVVVDCKLMERRKLVMHLFKKSLLEKRFGEVMVRQVLKVMAE